METEQTWEEWATEIFVGDNYHYYKVKWEHQKPDRSFTSWNWVAFFFPYYWMAYRKMYMYAFLVIIFSILAYIIPFGGIAVHAIAGTYANYFYYNKCGIEVKTASQYSDEDAIAYLKKKGGTSSTSVILSIVIIVSIVAIILVGIILLANSTSETTSSSTESVLSSDEPTNEIITKGGEISYTVPEFYEEEDYPNQDLHLYSSFHNVTLLSFVYSQEDYTEIANEQYFIDAMVKQFEDIYTLTPVADAELPVLDSQLPQVIYSSAEEDGSITYIYLTCKKIDNYYVVSASLSSPSGWKKYKDQILEIISSAKSNAPDKIAVVPLKFLRGTTAISLFLSSHRLK